MSAKIHYITVDSSSDELDYEVEPEPVEVKCEDGAVISRIANLGRRMEKVKCEDGAGSC